MFIYLSPDVGKIPCTANSSILDAIQHNSHVPLASICGGQGLCGKCRIQILKGKVTPPAEEEKKFLSSDEIASGIRLACLCFPLTSVSIHIEEETSFAAPYKTALFMSTDGLDLKPNVCKKQLHLESPTLEDPTPDLQRVLEKLESQQVAAASVSHHVFPQLPGLLRGAEWEVTAVVVNSILSGIEPGNTSDHTYGIAFDLGTTTVAAYLLDLSNGELLAQAAETNRQVKYGADVMTRIDRAHEGDLYFMQAAALASLNSLVRKVTKDTAVSPANIYEAVVVGNTCMHHILLGIDPYQAGVSPFIPFLKRCLNLPADEVGLHIAQGSNLHLLPLVSGFIGADTIADIISLDLDRAREPHLLIDIGTNAEMALAVEGRIWVCAAAAGPAFEGARISCGMRAGSGAIDQVEIDGNRLRYRTIDNEPAAGIAGSGLISAVAAFKRAGFLTQRGRIRRQKIPHAWLTADQDGILLAAADESLTGKPVVITWRDMGEELIIAKAAIRTGLEILLEKAGLQAEDLVKISIAGAFGNYLNLDAAIEIGLFPDLPRGRFVHVGNAAGKGAVRALLSTDQRHRADECLNISQYVELSTYPEFNGMFAGNMKYD